MARIVVAATVSWQVCVWLGATQPPVYAVLVPLVTLRDEPGSAWNLSFSRLVGVVAGLLVGIGVLAWLRPSTAALALVLVLALGLAMVFRAGGAMNTQIALSALLVLANADPEAYAVSRMWETAVGAVVTAVLAPLLFPTNPARAFRRELRATAEECVAVLRAADAADQAHTAHVLDDRAHALAPALATARRAVRFHPLWRHRDSAGLAALEPVTEATAAVAELVRIHADDLVELRARPDTAEWWAEQGAGLRELEHAVADAVAAVLVRATDGSAGSAGDAAIAHARSVLGAFSAADPSRIGPFARRPLARILTVLQGRDAPLGPPGIPPAVEPGAQP